MSGEVEIAVKYWHASVCDNQQILALPLAYFVILPPPLYWGGRVAEQGWTSVISSNFLYSRSANRMSDSFPAPVNLNSYVENIMMGQGWLGESVI
jgi:hypothetical protein